MQNSLSSKKSNNTNKPPFSVVVAGSRQITDQNDPHSFQQLVEILDQLRSKYNLTIFSGAAQGADSFAIDYATKYQLTVKIFAADWKRYGKAAGPIRNQQMAMRCNNLIAVWDGKSRGTLNMITQMKKYNPKSANITLIMSDDDINTII